MLLFLFILKQDISILSLLLKITSRSLGDAWFREIIFLKQHSEKCQGMVVMKIKLVNVG